MSNRKNKYSCLKAEQIRLLIFAHLLPYYDIQLIPKSSRNIHPVSIMLDTKKIR
eukprot:GAHX01002183.1.p1 GENE.GAHX01002183.1~~GAHX01002183.1.p1  ORF type:complete len:54 (+),score=4.77 GAHX01002183.1:200-361(+)